MSVLLLTKLALAPSIVASGTVAGRRWGHQVGGVVAGFPNTSSPILLFLALERGPAFAADAAVGTLLGLVSLAAYGLTYVWAATRFRWWLALPLGWAAFLAVAWPLRRVELNRWQAGLLAVAALAVALKAMPSLLEPPSTAAASGPTAEAAAALRAGSRSAASNRSFLGPRPRAELAFRMAAAVALLLGVTLGAGWLGPNLSGVFSAFPVASSVLTAAAHREAGAAGAKWVLMGIFLALLALIVFTALLPLLLAAFPLWKAFVYATALGFAGQALVLWRRHALARLLARF